MTDDFIRTKAAVAISDLFLYATVLLRFVR